MYTTYVLKNENNKIYIGHTENLESRLQRHNGQLSSRKKSYTNKNRCGEWIVVHQEEFQTRGEALRREKKLKSYQGRKFIKEIISQSVDPPAGGLLS